MFNQQLNKTISIILLTAYDLVRSITAPVIKAHISSRKMKWKWTELREITNLCQPCRLPFLQFQSGPRREGDQYLAAESKHRSRHCICKIKPEEIRFIILFSTNPRDLNKCTGFFKVATIWPTIWSQNKWRMSTMSFWVCCIQFQCYSLTTHGFLFLFLNRQLSPLFVERSTKCDVFLYGCV